MLRHFRTLGALFLPVALVLATGCTTRQYRKKADKEVYGIIQGIEAGVFGHTNRFNIDTSWSRRDPDSVLASEIIHGRLETNHLALSIDKALDLMANQSSRYQTEKERLYLTALTLSGQRYAFSPQFFAGSAATWQRNASGVETGGLHSQIGLNQLLKTGGQLSVSLANDILRYYTGDPSQTVINTLSVNLTQPLLRGFGRNNPAVENLTQAERNVVYAVRSYSFFQKQFAIEIVDDYFNLLEQKNIIRNNYSNYVSQVESTTRLEARADRETRNQVDLARQSELAARNNYVNSIANYFNSLDTFKIKLNIPLNVRVQLDDANLKQLQTIGLIPVSLKRDAAFRLAVDRNYNIVNSIDQFEDSKRKLHVAADQLRTDFSINGNASLASNPPEDYTHFDIDKVAYSAGLQLNLPIDRLRERNNYRAALVSFEAQLRTLALDLDNLKDQVDRGVRTLEQQRQNYLIQQSALELANQRVESNALLLQAGRAEVRDLVDAQNARIAAQNDVTSALVNYQATRLDLLLNLGVISTDQPEFWFQNHLKQTPGILASETNADVPSRDQIVTPDKLFSN